MLDTPTLKAKIKNDYWMMTFLVMFVIYIIMGTLIYVLESTEIYIALILLGFTVFSLIGMIARSKIIDNYFATGMMVTATISKIRRYSRYPYFKVIYKINNTDFEKKIYVSKLGKSREYKEDSNIKIIVDQDNPKKAIIYSFYEVNE